ncbi:MAG: hypothetical protein ACLFQB_01015 [Chitinispirillaceae bacterium]
MISDLDSTLTNLEGAFRKTVLDSNDIQEAFSIPEGADSLFSTKKTSYLLIGRKGSEHAFGHMQFDLTDSVPYPASYGSDDTLKSVCMFVKTVGGTSDSESVNIHISSELDSLAPVKRGDSELLDSITLIKKQTDSIVLPEELSKDIFDARTETSAGYTFSFSIPDSLKMMKILKPYIIVNVTKEDGKTVRDSIGCTARFTIYEDTEAADSLSAIPYSSHSSQRTAVFEINTEDIFETMNNTSKTLYSEVLNSVITLKTESEAPDSVYFKFLLLDDLIEGDSLKTLFNREPSLKLSSTLTLPVRRPVQKILRGARKPLYAYLRLSSSESGYENIVWSKPKMEIVLTPSR